jgi:hypothetical protein
MQEYTRRNYKKYPVKNPYIMQHMPSKNQLQKIVPGQAQILLRAPPHRYSPHPRRPASPRAAATSAQRRRFGLGRFGLARAEPRHLASSPSTATPTVLPSGGGRLSALARSSDTKITIKITKEP